MATTTKYAVEITFTNDQMNETTLRLDNALKTGGTLSQVRDVFAEIMGSNDMTVIGDPNNSHLFDKNHRPIIFIPRAELIITETTRTELEQS